MPEGERDGAYDPEEDFPWDPDLTAAGESDTADLLNEDDDDE